MLHPALLFEYIPNSYVSEHVHMKCNNDIERFEKKLMKNCSEAFLGIISNETSHKVLSKHEYVMDDGVCFSRIWCQNETLTASWEWPLNYIHIPAIYHWAMCHARKTL